MEIMWSTNPILNIFTSVRKWVENNRNI